MYDLNFIRNICKINNSLNRASGSRQFFFVRGYLESNLPPNLTKSDSLFSRKLRQTVTKFIVQKSHVEISI
jgi:hypothetical protein